MSRRTIADYIRQGFLSRDKASCDAVIKDAEAEIPPPEDEDHKEPDGDEGGGDNKAVHIHIAHGDGKTDDSIDARVAKLETGMKSIDGKITQMLDAFKKDELPPWLKKGGDDEEGEGEGGGDPTAEKPDAEAAEGDPPPDDDKKEETADMEVAEGETGALSMEKLGEAEPELMNADPSKKTGQMRMGDAATVQRNLARLIKDTRARAEILNPGIKFPTIDAKPSLATVKGLCGLRRAALGKASKAALGRFTPATIKAMSCDSVRVLFLDASDRQKAANNATHHGYVTGDDVFVAHDSQVERLKAINVANRDFWAKQTGAVRH